MRRTIYRKRKVEMFMLGMIKIGDAARRLGITTMELRDSAHRGEIKSARTPGGVHYFREQDLEGYAQTLSLPCVRCPSTP